jgi:hypothetical protein
MALVELGAGSGVFYEVSTVGSGTGNYNSFLRLQNKPDERGFNTDDSNEADNKDGIWTHALLVGSLVEVDVGGVLYYEIRLDLNEGNAEGDPPITLEDLRLFYSAAPADGDDYDNGFIDLTQVFDLSGSLALTDINTGSGTDDYRFLIRADLFPDKTAYFTLYSEFSGSDGGFEEWRAKSQDIGDGLPAITIVKDANPVTVYEDTPTDVTYTYTLTSQSSVTDPLTLTSLIDDGATPLDSSDDIDLLAGVDVTHPLGIYYVSGDTDADQLLDSSETWIFSYTRTGVLLNAGETLVNVVAVNAVDDEGNNVVADDDATVTGLDVLPDVGIVKTASLTSIQAGSPTLVTYSYQVTNDSLSTLDPLTLTSLVDDSGTLGDTSDDVDLLEGVDALNPLGIHYVSGDDGDELLETGETWLFQDDVILTLAPGETRTNVVTVNADDDEGNSVSASDDAAVTAYNLGRTPGFWSNNGSLLWDGNTSTFPKAGGLGIVDPGEDLAYAIHDLNGDGVIDNVAGSRQYLMIGDWDKDGVADANENVLVISRANALSLLNSSEKQQQDGRYVLSRDMVASWLNYLGGSYVGDSDDPNSAMHYLDEATAWLIETTSDHNHVLTVSELTAGTKIAQSGWAWQYGYDFDGDNVGGENMVPAAGQHDIGAGTTLDILGGSAIHTGLDHYNNYGFII